MGNGLITQGFAESKKYHGNEQLRALSVTHRGSRLSLAKQIKTHEKRSYNYDAVRRYRKNHARLPTLLALHPSLNEHMDLHSVLFDPDLSLGFQYFIKYEYQRAENNPLRPEHNFAENALMFWYDITDYQGCSNSNGSSSVKNPKNNVRFRREYSLSLYAQYFSPNAQTFIPLRPAVVTKIRFAYSKFDMNQDGLSNDTFEQAKEQVLDFLEQGAFQRFKKSRTLYGFAYFLNYTLTKRARPDVWSDMILTDQVPVVIDPVFTLFQMLPDFRSYELMGSIRPIVETSRKAYQLAVKQSHNNPAPLASSSSLMTNHPPPALASKNSNPGHNGAPAGAGKVHNHPMRQRRPSTAIQLVNFDPNAFSIASPGGPTSSPDVFSNNPDNPPIDDSLTIEDILESPRYCNVFRQFLERYGQERYLCFFLDVLEYHQMFDTLRRIHNQNFSEITNTNRTNMASPKMIYVAEPENNVYNFLCRVALDLYQTYLKARSRTNLFFHPEVIRGTRKLLMRKKLHSNAFQQSMDYVFALFKEVLYPRFRESDEFHELIVEEGGNSCASASASSDKSMDLHPRSNTTNSTIDDPMQEQYTNLQTNRLKSKFAYLKPVPFETMMNSPAQMNFEYFIGQQNASYAVTLRFLLEVRNFHQIPVSNQEYIHRAGLKLYSRFCKQGAKMELTMVPPQLRAWLEEDIAEDNIHRDTFDLIESHITKFLQLDQYSAYQRSGLYVGLLAHHFSSVEAALLVPAPRKRRSSISEHIPDGYVAMDQSSQGQSSSPAEEPQAVATEFEELWQHERLLIHFERYMKQQKIGNLLDWYYAMSKFEEFYDVYDRRQIEFQALSLHKYLMDHVKRHAKFESEALLRKKSLEKPTAISQDVGNIALPTSERSRKSMSFSRLRKTSSSVSSNVSSRKGSLFGLSKRTSNVGLNEDDAAVALNTIGASNTIGNSPSDEHASRSLDSTNNAPPLLKKTPTSVRNSLTSLATLTAVLSIPNFPPGSIQDVLDAIKSRKFTKDMFVIVLESMFDHFRLYVYPKFTKSADYACLRHDRHAISRQLCHSSSNKSSTGFGIISREYKNVRGILTRQEGILSYVSYLQDQDQGYLLEWVNLWIEIEDFATIHHSRAYQHIRARKIQRNYRHLLTDPTSCLTKLLTSGDTPKEPTIDDLIAHFPELQRLVSTFLRHENFLTYLASAAFQDFLVQMKIRKGLIQKQKRRTQSFAQRVTTRVGATLRHQRPAMQSMAIELHKMNNNSSGASSLMMQEVEEEEDEEESPASPRSLEGRSSSTRSIGDVDVVESFET